MRSCILTVHPSPCQAFLLTFTFLIHHNSPVAFDLKNHFSHFSYVPFFQKYLNSVKTMAHSSVGATFILNLKCSSELCQPPLSSDGPQTSAHRHQCQWRTSSPASAFISFQDILSLCMDLLSPFTECCYKTQNISKHTIQPLLLNAWLT